VHVCSRSSVRSSSNQQVIRHCGLEGKAEFKWIGGARVTMTRFDPLVDDKFMCVTRGLEVRGKKLWI